MNVHFKGELIYRRHRSGVLQAQPTKRFYMGVKAANSRLETSPSNGSSTSQLAGLVTLEEVQRAAKRRGLAISVKELGPFYRIVCRDGSEEGQVLGVTSGFVAPWFGIMHCDTLQIFTRGLKGDAGQRIRGGVLGLGLLLGGATFTHGFYHGCRTAEILAINDNDAWHERLVKYYSYFGFRPVCRVGGNGLADLPHLLVWGGEGTRMNADIEAMLQRWTPSLRAAAAAAADDRSAPPDTN
ncbi:hypothetical protein Vafri_13126 [Volvox africanus]|uniref:Uncharacterized protein n=1 Tax=Volvox africanus TaxID=51714 RepID=A0A8J4BBH1_9CHLO|nr:hypothetical protein Vafri_13126 [Volvox africanus]